MIHPTDPSTVPPDPPGSGKPEHPDRLPQTAG